MNKRDERMKSRAIRTILVLIIALAIMPAVASAQMSLDAPEQTASPGDTVTLEFTLENTGSEPKAFIMDVGELPEGWEIESRSDKGGVWQDVELKWLFQTIEPDSSKTPSLTVNVPESADGQYEIDVTAKTNDNQITQTTTVTVEETETTEGDQTGESDTDGSTEEEPTAEPEERTTEPADDEGTTDTDNDGVPDSEDYAPRDPEVQSREDVQSPSSPGFTVGVTLVALLVVIAAAVVYRRRTS